MSKDNTPSGPERSVDELAKELYPTISMNYCTGPIDYQNKNSVQNEFREAFKAGFLAASPKGKDTSSILKRYRAYVSNIEWHIRVNKPINEGLRDCELKLEIYKEVVKDLESHPLLSTD